MFRPVAKNSTFSPWQIAALWSVLPLSTTMIFFTRQVCVRSEAMHVGKCRAPL
jgi:hypothetical protein